MAQAHHITVRQTPSWSEIESPRSLRRTLGIYRTGRRDPTTRLTDGRFLRGSLTPDGPGTLLLRWAADPVPPATAGLSADAWGPGAGWLLDRVDLITGAADRSGVFDAAHPTVERSLRLFRGTRIAASGDLYHQLLPTIIGQRITGGEAVRQWAALCWALGEPAPGPTEIVGDLRLPPSPASLHRRPAWWFHPLGIETKRARPLTEVARHADKLWRWAEAGAPTTAEKLALLPGVGAWTIGSVLGPALGDPDAVPTGDYHFPNVVAYALAGEARADDDRMLELLEPYRGQRGRVLWALVSIAGAAPKFGPRQRILPMSRW
ncbi:MAG: DNA-3-methyladenine glycosylase 2 family protein [Ilumatobacteraceae bacterium]